MTLRRSLGTALLITVPAYLVAVQTRILAGRMVGDGAEGAGHSPLPGFATYTVLFVVSLLLMAFVDRRPWSDLGLRKAAGRWLKFPLWALLVGAITTFTLKFTPGKGMADALRLTTPILIVPMLLYGSTAEEFFMRGWFQSFLDPLRDRTIPIGGFAPSLPVVASALGFGAMHLTLLGKGVDAWTIGFVLVFTTTVGLLAATVRERTGSLWPAVVTHLAGNAGGFVGGILWVVQYAIRFGKPPAM